MEKTRVLVIDDDPNLRRTLSDILKAKGYEAHSAKDGAEGLALLERHQVSVALVDLQLPGISGLELLARIRSDYPSTEVIILTGNSELEMAEKAIQLGAVNYITKPFEPALLREVVLSSLRGAEGGKKAGDRPWQLKEKNANIVPSV